MERPEAPSEVAPGGRWCMFYRNDRLEITWKDTFCCEQTADIQSVDGVDFFAMHIGLYVVCVDSCFRQICSTYLFPMVIAYLYRYLCAVSVSDRWNSEEKKSVIID